MGKLETYDVVVNGQATRMRLNEADAKRYGGTPVKKRQAPQSSNEPAKKTSASKKRSAPNKSGS